MVADREMPAWQWTNTLPPAFLMESGKQRVAVTRELRGTTPTPGRRRLRNLCVLSREWQHHLCHHTVLCGGDVGIVQRTARDLNQDQVSPQSRLILDGLSQFNFLSLPLLICWMGHQIPNFAGMLPTPDCYFMYGERLRRMSFKSLPQSWARWLKGGEQGRSPRHLSIYLWSQ